MRRRIRSELEREDFVAVVAEQIHALAQVPQAPETPPVVLRAQNVESDLWTGQSRLAGVSVPLRSWLRFEARRLAAAEGEAVARIAATVALTDHDAKVLRRLAGRPARVDVIPAIVDPELPAGPALDGDPAVVLFGSAGWRPNADGARSFLAGAWPGIRERLPRAILHLFGEPPASVVADARIRHHPSPHDSATALAAGSILVVPLNVASGVRMKILEAWSRGVAVVASATAARGLVADSGGELEVVEESGDWADAVLRCVEFGDAMRQFARRRLRQTYSAGAVVQRWAELFEELSKAPG